MTMLTNSHAGILDDVSAVIPSSSMSNTTEVQSPPIPSILSSPVLSGNFQQSAITSTPKSILAPDLAVTEEPNNDGPSTQINQKNLVLCFDGTLDEFDADNSNVVQLFSFLDKNDSSQKLYYQAGIGTYLTPQFIMPITEKVMKLVDAAIGWNLKTHIMNGYEFIMQNYEPGDKISIFGFSRGAYTARALAGMLCAVGLLPRDNSQQISFAYKIYMEGSDEEEDPYFARCLLFKETYSRNVEIEFLGIWDTVMSVGLSNNRLPFTTFNPLVKRVRHALALDEHRVKFVPSLWHYGKQRTAVELATDRHRKIPFSFRGRMTSQHDELLRRELSVAECFGGRGYDDVKEVWFAGCHSDVGGGAVFNDAPNSLARIPLRWMIKECVNAGLGLVFVEQRLLEIGLYTVARAPPHSTSLRLSRDGSRPPRPSVDKGLSGSFDSDNRPESSEGNPSATLRRTLRRTVTPALRTISTFTRPRPSLSVGSPGSTVQASPSSFSSYSFRKQRKSNPFQRRTLDSRLHGSPVRNERTELLGDAEAPVHCQLTESRFWWILEVLPFRLPYQTEDGRWKATYVPHFGKFRTLPIPSEGKRVQVHHSVREKILAKPRPGQSAYSPKATILTLDQDGRPKWERLSLWSSNVDWVHDADVSTHRHHH